METTYTAPTHPVATPAGGTDAPAGCLPGNPEALTVRTEMRAGAVWGNHSEALEARTEMWAGAPHPNHSEALAVRTEVRAGGIWPNHSEAVTAAG